MLFQGYKNIACTGELVCHCSLTALLTQRHADEQTTWDNLKTDAQGRQGQVLKRCRCFNGFNLEIPPWGKNVQLNTQVSFTKTGK